jgi:drug/metabolite transporter (DMT)-like permease
MTATAQAAGPANAAPLALLALAAGAAAMGASTIFVRLAATEGVGPFASAFWRGVLALPFLWAWALAEARGGPVWRGGLTRPVLLAGLFFAGDLFFWHLAILGTTVANATFLATTAPVWVVLATVFLLKARVARGAYLGLALCLAGGALLIGQSYSFAPERLPGDAYGLITAVFFAAYFLVVGEARRSGLGSARITLIATAVTTAVLFLVALALEPRLLPQTAAGWGWLLALALVSQVGGQGLLAVALGHLPAVFSSLVIFFEAVAAAALGWLVLGEALGALQFAGGVAILAGIFVARPRRGAPPT